MGFQGKLSEYVEENPYKPGPGDAWLKRSAVSVWALVAYLKLSNWDIGYVARIYDLPVDEVEAAAAYYEEHRCAIDARLEANRAVAS